MIKRIRATWLAALCLIAAACADEPFAPETSALSSIESDTSMARLITTHVRAEDLVPDRYMVVFRPATVQSRTISAALARTHGFTLHHQYGAPIPGFSATLTAGQLNAVRRNLNVAYVEQVSLLRPSQLPVSAQPYAPWGLDRIDQRTMPLDTFYTYNDSAENSVIYVFDTGVRASHTEFDGRVEYAFDINPGGIGVPCPGTFHGTAVASIAAGQFAGVAKQASIRNVKITRDCASLASSDDVAAATEWLWNYGVRFSVVAFNFNVTGESETMDAWIEASLLSGFTWVVSAGNALPGQDAEDACNNSPARIPGVIVTGASTPSDQRWSGSYWGPCVTIWAPGENIFQAGAESDTDMTYRHGTSFASPFVAGVAALAIERFGNIDPATLRQRLVELATETVVDDVVSHGSPTKLLYSKFVFGQISGPEQVSGCNGNMVFAAAVDGGKPAYTFSWWLHYLDENDAWNSELVGTSSMYTFCEPPNSRGDVFLLVLEVNDSNAHSHSSNKVLTKTP